MRIPKLCRKRRKDRPHDLAYVTIDGKQISLGAWGSPEARRRYADLIRGLDLPDEPAAPRGRRLTIAELRELYDVHAHEHYRKPDGTPTGELGNMLHVSATLDRVCGLEYADSFGPNDLRRVREALIGTGAEADEEAGTAADPVRRRSTVNAHVRRIRTIFRWAVSRELVPGTVLEPLRAVEPLKAGRSRAAEPVRRLPVLDAHVDATIAALGNHPEVVALIRLQRLTGARSGELLGMRPSDIDRSREPWILTPRRHKQEHTGGEKRIPLGPKARAVLRPWLEGRGPADLLFPRVVDGREVAHDRTSYRRRIFWAARRAGVPHWTPHQLRHALVTRVSELHGLDAAQTLVGHESLDATQHYRERRSELAQRLAEELG